MINSAATPRWQGHLFDKLLEWRRTFHFRPGNINGMLLIVRSSWGEVSACFCSCVWQVFPRTHIHLFDSVSSLRRLHGSESKFHVLLYTNLRGTVIRRERWECNSVMSWYSTRLCDNLLIARRTFSLQFLNSSDLSWLNKSYNKMELSIFSLSAFFIGCFSAAQL